MIFVLIIIVVLCIFGPQWWAKRILAQHAEERSDLPGSGAELAVHLLTQMKLDGYTVVAAEGGSGDHFDPRTQTVALSEAHHSKRSLSAAVVAAHEVGHAIQHHIGYRPLRLRSQLAVAAALAERVASVFLIAMPFVTILSRTPVAGAGMLVVGITIMALPVVVHLVTLPVEFDASFKRAMPILEQGYLDADDIPRARRILTACALTYFAASLSSLLNFWRWIRVLRR